MHPPGRHPQVESLDGDLTVSAAAEVGLAQPGVGDREVVRVVIGELKLTFNLELILQAVDRAAAADFAAFCAETGHDLLATDEEDGVLGFTIRRREEPTG